MDRGRCLQGMISMRLVRTVCGVLVQRGPVIFIVIGCAGGDVLRGIDYLIINLLVLFIIYITVILLV